MAAALKAVKVTGSFCPWEVGAKVGMDKHQAEMAARALAIAGILTLGFDSAAHFTPDFRKSQTPAVPKAARKKKKKARQLV